MKIRRFAPALLALLCWGGAAAAPAAAQTVLVEAEGFADPGGWSLDTQFIHIMGSPYLLAHGLGEPVKDAATTVKFPSTGTYRVFVRTKDWVARWKAPGQPGKFQVTVDGKPLAATFGTEGADWHWQDGGKVEVTKPEAAVGLHDLTGFEGRCDAIVFSKDPAFVPPNDAKELGSWRKAALGLPDKPVEAGPFDLVVVGGGYGGLGAAISAARMGCKVALIQDRPVLGGNGSSEIRVWSMGGTTTGKYPMLGQIVEEFADRAKSSPGTKEEFGDDRKELITEAEKNIALFLDTHMYKVEMDGKAIKAVVAANTRTGAETRFSGKLFADTTGHGSLGAMAGAEFAVQEKGHMGMSNMWRWAEGDKPAAFPKADWALPLEMKDFPYPVRGKAEWFWEGGFFRDPIQDLEYIRDWNFRAAYGAFNAMKNGDGAAKHTNAKLEWMAYIGGNRESRLLRGDIVLSREDIVSKKEFPDASVPTTWDIDIHEPKEQYAKKFPQDPFISKAVFGKGVDRQNGYPIPYRCFYAKDVPNLFMAGRQISVDHEALGTIRVMRTIGMMGEVVGKAASICVKNNCGPREVYSQYLDELKELMSLPGNARRERAIDPVDPKAALPYDANATGGRASSHSRKKAAATQPAAGAVAEGALDPKKLAGIVVDDAAAKLTGTWQSGTGLPGFVGSSYRYAQSGSGASARFEFAVPAAGRYEVRALHQPHENRSPKVRVTVVSADGEKVVEVNQQAAGTAEHGFTSLGTYAFDPAKPGAVVVTTEGAAKGNVAIDAVQVVPGK
ncbi:MAG: soluble pyridine nucleotide transhydrogenase [Phycisphaerales bacterium]|nr:soluble pyridine nucleotide transhydrogenase [Phycisphaerales bacterium]